MEYTYRINSKRTATIRAEMMKNEKLVIMHMLSI